MLSSAAHLSLIQSFTPSRYTAPTIAPPSGPVLVNGSSSDDAVATSPIPLCSYTNMPILSSRISHASNNTISTSSSRPLFSPTQTSNFSSRIYSGAASGPPTRVVTLHGQNRQLSASPQKAEMGIGEIDTHHISTPMSSATRDGRAPHQSRVVEVSDDEVEEEVEERVEVRPELPRSRAVSTINVVVATGEKNNKNKVWSSEKKHRRGSPDPLDFNLKRPSSKVAQTPTSRSSVPPSTGKKLDSSVPPESQRTQDTSTSGPTRISKRVQVQRAKEEEEKDKRRETRRLRKSKDAEAAKRLAEKQQKAEHKLVGERRSKRGHVEDVEESIVPMSATEFGTTKSVPEVEKSIRSENDTERDENVQSSLGLQKKRRRVVASDAEEEEGAAEVGVVAEGKVVKVPGDKRQRGRADKQKKKAKSRAVVRLRSPEPAGHVDAVPKSTDVLEAEVVTATEAVVESERVAYEDEDEKEEDDNVNKPTGVSTSLCRATILTARDRPPTRLQSNRQTTLQRRIVLLSQPQPQNATLRYPSHHTDLLRDRATDLAVSSGRRVSTSVPISVD